MNKKSRLLSLVSLFVLASMLLVACGGAAATEAPAGDAIPAGDGKVSIFGGYGEAQAAAYQKALTEFGQANGIEVTFTPLATFDTGTSPGFDLRMKADGVSLISPPMRGRMEFLRLSPSLSLRNSKRGDPAVGVGRRG